MLRKLAFPLAIFLAVLFLWLLPLPLTGSDQAGAALGRENAATGPDAPALNLADCPDRVEHLDASTVTMQVIDYTFHKWREYSTEDEFFIYLEAPEERPLTANEARELLDDSGEWADLLVPVPDLVRAWGVFGPDERIRVPGTETRVYPWNTVGYVESSFPDGNRGRASAFLVTPYVALTNGHVVYLPEHGGWFDQLVFWPGQTQEFSGGPVSRPFGSAQAVNARIPRVYAETSQEAPYDYGAVFFERAFSGISTFMPLEFDAYPNYINIAGYPFQVQGENGSLALWHSFGPVVQVWPQAWFFRADATQGNSGGPIWAYSSGAGTHRAVGILSHIGPTHNFGPRFAAHNLETIENWMAWTPGSTPETEYTLTILREGQGTTTPEPGEHSYREGTEVELRAEPDPGWEFDSWVVDDRAVSQPRVTVTMNTHRQATARFRPVTQDYRLNVEVKGQGSVIPRPGVHSFPPGTRVELSAQPAAGWEFDRWVVDGLELERPSITITMDSHRTAAAHFRAASREKVDVFLNVGDRAYTVNGARKSMDVAPFIADGRTFVPLRFVAEEFAMEAAWGPEEGRTRWVSFVKEGLRVDLTIGSPEIQVTASGVEYTVQADVPAHIRDGRTYLPLRALGETLGVEFDWGPRSGRTQWVRFTGNMSPAHANQTREGGSAGHN